MSRQKAKRPPFGRKSRTATPKQHIRLFGVCVALSPLVWQLCIFAVPLILLAALGTGTVKGLELLAQNSLRQVFGWSLGLALLSATATTLLALPCAYVLAFKVSAGIRRWAVYLLCVPFITSYLVRAYGWQMLLSEGIVNGVPDTLVRYLTLTLPLVVVLQLVGFIKIDRDLIEAAQNLGCRPIGVLVQVIWPMARGWIVIAALACFVLSYGDFIAPRHLDAGSVPNSERLAE